MVTQLPQVPGVYWQDVFPPAPAEFVTGVPAFLGIWPGEGLETNTETVAGTDETVALYRPYPLRLWPQFEQYFGLALGQVNSPQPPEEPPKSFVADVVRSFFENGGTDCVVLWLKEASTEALSQGLEVIASLSDVDLICAPDLVNPDWVKSDNRALTHQLQAQILRHCDESGEQFALLDAVPGTVADIQSQSEFLSKAQGSRRGALYGPFVRVAVGHDVPPCGCVAGTVAKCDRATGVHQTPANLPLEGVLDLAPSAPSGLETIPYLNSLCSFRGRGIRIWGGRTLSSAPQWRFVNVSRLFITLHRWAEGNLTTAAFEPNDFRLWSRIERELNAYLFSLWQAGALQGDVPEAGFWVRCDVETNPPESRDLGQVITLVGLAPSIPNEFIQVRLIHGETGVALAPTG